MDRPQGQLPGRAPLAARTHGDLPLLLCVVCGPGMVPFASLFLRRLDAASDIREGMMVPPECLSLESLCKTETRREQDLEQRRTWQQSVLQSVELTTSLTSWARQKRRLAENSSLSGPLIKALPGLPRLTVRTSPLERLPSQRRRRPQAVMSSECRRWSQTSRLHPFQAVYSWGHFSSGPVRSGQELMIRPT